MRLFLALLAVPLIEIALFVQVGGELGLLATLAIVIGSAIGGIALIRSGGPRTVGEINAALRTETDPTAPLLKGVMRVIAGMLLIIPGFFTDILGLIVLLPPVQAMVLARMPRPRTQGPTRPRRGDVIDGDFTVHEPRDSTPWREIPDTPPAPGPDRNGGQNRH
ncbi:FxsA family protein [Roseicitreum antarcticum]|uniref:UPF0716 protein FxsA n=1 Tax=Roseicitreum antarcticum TaxID=564137 RepID=A0A1H2QZI0_9RHOB|nr:FxsA family protein [Roseicitreum antarcticum]SDW12622.1 UPF0716 protein FxsA [Roseicitreum antarcticum]